mmetsp:Transcript_16778/g.36290  ORF Transcript_16778/g.36290 Transcript_16778/m.36290 type:complete len:235 (+) Transcript_16778:1498-2202(+)
MATSGSRPGRRLSTTSSPDECQCWLLPTWQQEVWMCPMSQLLSTLMLQRTRRTTCTASGAPGGQEPRARASRCSPRETPIWHPSSSRSLRRRGSPFPLRLRTWLHQRGAAPAARTAPPSGAAAGAAAGAAEGGTGTTASSAAMETGPPGARAAGQMGTMRGVMAGSSAAGAGAATQSTTRASWGGRTWREIHTVHTVHTGVGGTAAVTRWMHGSSVPCYAMCRGARVKPPTCMS